MQTSLLAVALVALASSALTNARFAAGADLDPATRWHLPLGGSLDSLAPPPLGKPLGKSLYYCGNPDEDLVTVSSVNLTPDPPHKGQTLRIEASGHVKQTVTNGSYVDVTVKYGFIKLLSRRFDLCDYLDQVGHACPVPPGVVSITKEVDLPKEIPRGRYTVNAVARLPDEGDDTGAQLTCLNALVRF
ncbi:Phosphatidylglycerol/phosphatidylinositol transfer protein [Tieghemiomyces parasiticus]|uniref:Phosphatidylglycerol/phosphatidylinositol transfer protein n=1 Tax=Tieghemiomyces parasiticus TaxID=78921 RepID=A0A9W8A953_9FUNG|nr:Phosphatidylglycerol/phosphatidylinositol transfer protein [Tieghemiomyces parasiticus]